MSTLFSSFTSARGELAERFRNLSYEVLAPRWQGIDVSQKPEMAMRELFDTSFRLSLRGIEDLKHWNDDLEPNQPWADEHFAERVSRRPLNPGSSWRNWPWGNSADKFRDQPGAKFTHTYMERIWPKFAGRPQEMHVPNEGIRFEYGDLDDAIKHLQKDPLSRQCYVPIWFPEDGTCEGRRPCTLGYHFLMRHDYLHCTYYIRSCDFVRHWADDCYLAVRLLLWVLGELRTKDEKWREIRPGLFVMHIASLHMFVNDYRKLRGR